jgi:hypothetical protein
MVYFYWLIADVSQRKIFDSIGETYHHNENDRKKRYALFYAKGLDKSLTNYDIIFRPAAQRRQSTNGKPAHSGRFYPTN